MNQKTLLKFIETHRNPHVILDKDKNVLYANAIAKEIFSNDLNTCFGDFSKCDAMVIENKKCQETSKCSECKLHKTLKKIIEDGQKCIAENFEFEFKFNKLNVSFEATSIDDYLIIEFLRIDKDEDEAYLLNRICNRSKDLLFYKDSTLTYKYVNDAYSNFLALDKKSIIGKTDKELLPPEMLEECLRTDNYALNHSAYAGTENAGGQHFRVLKERVDDGIMCLAQNITSEIELGELANVDELTKLLNRRKFNTDIEAIYKNKNDNYYIILIDIDDFSNINNTYGHDVGDKYLIELSEKLNKQKAFTFYRLGGDEFIGLINSNENDIKKLVEKIFIDIEKENKISISAGVKKLDITVSYNQNYNLLDELLYSSKKNGKKQVSYFNN